MPEPIVYELATIHDIFTKVPTDRIRDCLSELGVLLSQAAATRDLFVAAAEEVGVDPGGVIPNLPEFFTWIDDGKGDLTMRVLAKTNENDAGSEVFSITTHIPQQ